MAQLFVEYGALRALKTFARITISGAPVFHTFLMLTRASWFDHVLLWGGAKYQATGRGVSLRRAPIREIFMRYARSHFRFAFEIESKIDVKVTFAFEIEYLAEIAIEVGAAAEESDIVEVKSNFEESDRESNSVSEPEVRSEIKEN